MSHQGRFSFIAFALFSLVSFLILNLKYSYASTQDNNWYKIELLAFELKGPINEQGQHVVPAKLPKHAIYLNNHLATQTQHWSPLPYDQAFHQAALRIAKQARYKIIFQSAWLQDDKQKRPLIIESGDNLAPIALAKKEMIILKGPLWQLEGYITIKKQRTFNTHLLLAYRLLTPQDQLAEYSIDEYRSLKLNQIHYFDNPAFGILIRISSAEAPVAVLFSQQELNSSEVS